jgi:hypothetical protein
MKPRDFGVDKIPFIGQTGDRPYEERQQEPGDYDAVASQGAVANRAAEHLGTADRGVVLFRKMLGNAIRDVANSATPPVPGRCNEGDVRTYAHEVVIKVPGEAGLGDPVALAAFGRKTAQAFIDTADLPPAAREAEVERRVRALVDSLASATALVK